MDEKPSCRDLLALTAIGAVSTLCGLPLVIWLGYKILGWLFFGQPAGQLGG